MRKTQALLGGCGLLALLALLLGCSTSAPPPDWQIGSYGAMQRTTIAQLEGRSRVEAVEFEHARSEIARTGRADLLARAELLRCAARVASLNFDPCTGYDKLQLDAGPSEQAYARYLRAQPLAADLQWLPAPQRLAASWILARQSEAAQDSMLRGIEDPLSRLVAAGVLFQAGLARPPLLEVAVETASAQGWNRPLLAWLQVQASLAEQTGAQDRLAALRRRIELVLSGAAMAQP